MTARSQRRDAPLPGLDPLVSLLSSFSLQAGVFYTGNICGIHDFDRDTQRGHLHLVRRGVVRLEGKGRLEYNITEPTLVFLPRPEFHRLIADNGSGADVVCGTVHFGGGRNPVTDSLPDIVMIQLCQLQGVEMILDLMFQEAFADQTGRQAVLDRLCEVLVVMLLRHCIEHGVTRGGALAGLADTRIAPALQAMHDAPACAWSLEALAKVAHMSRARFAARFKSVTGTTVADYLASWRLMSAQRLLVSGMAPKAVAHEVGYANASALARAFTRQLGVTPLAWRRAQATSVEEGTLGA
jgi:AraC-like DNA-binding protein